MDSEDKGCIAKPINKRTKRFELKCICMISHVSLNDPDMLFVLEGLSIYLYYLI